MLMKSIEHMFRAVPAHIVVVINQKRLVRRFSAAWPLKIKMRTDGRQTKELGNERELFSLATRKLVMLCIMAIVC